MHEEPQADGSEAIAALHHLTGPSRGRTSWLHAPVLEVALAPDRRVRVRAPGEAETETPALARLSRAGADYLIAPAGDAPLWVNGRAVAERRLAHGDMIEFGPHGPLSRFQLCDALHPPPSTVAGIVSDLAAYLRASRKPVAEKLRIGASRAGGRLLRETTLLFRAGVVLALLAVAGVALWQQMLILRLEETVAAGEGRLDSVAAALARAREEALRPADLTALQSEISGTLAGHVERLRALESRWAAGAKVVAESAGSIAFLQGAYGFRHAETGRLLRHVVDAAGRPLMSGSGQPLLTLDGEGPVAERDFTGTGFLIADGGRIVTNRHVARPWERDATARAVASDGLEPVMTRFLAWFPGRAEAVKVTPLGASDTADLALLAPDGEVSGIAALTLAEAAPPPGSEVIVMGYPTGLRALLAQAGEAFVDSLRESGELDFWTVAERLAEGGAINPLASRGIVGQVTEAALVFDAETTHGGSGGPVLDMRGRVAAVQSAILPDYGGSNIAVPGEALRAFLAGTDASTPGN